MSCYIETLYLPLLCAAVCFHVTVSPAAALIIINRIWQLVSHGDWSASSFSLSGRKSELLARILSINFYFRFRVKAEPHFIPAPQSLYISFTFLHFISLILIHWFYTSDEMVYFCEMRGWSRISIPLLFLSSRKSIPLKLKCKLMAGCHFLEIGSVNMCDICSLAWWDLLNMQVCIISQSKFTHRI